MSVMHDLEQYVGKLTFENLDPSMPHLLPREEVIDSLLDILVQNPEVDEFFYEFDGDEWAKEIYKKAKKISDKTIRKAAVRIHISWAIAMAFVVSILLAR
jgi:hypothetical protein